ncbi:hypothetical protein ACHAWU_007877 [Discostella pseudostelligera]|uniref:Exocyst subunit Exo70 family protein n=1 Tax=Discostella pseudostelligera TaxID=259834 RepID=A0ABD3MDE7_9STRA
MATVGSTTTGGILPVGPTTSSSNTMLLLSDSSHSSSPIAALSHALSTLNSTTQSACHTCDGLSRSSRHLDSLTSPASETSALLAQTWSNLTSTSNILKDAREKFDTVVDTEPAVERLYYGAREACRTVAMHAERQGRGGVLPSSMKLLLKQQDRGSGISHHSGGVGGNNDNSHPLTEQELYAGADAMEIVRDAHTYFSKRLEWKSSRDTMNDLERVHTIGVDAMALLVTAHLIGAGAAVRRKVDGAATVVEKKSRGGGAASAVKSSAKVSSAKERAEETAAKTRDRLQEALQNRDLMKCIGEYEEYLPLSTRVVRELRAIFECLGGMTSSTMMPSTSSSRSLAQSTPPSIEPSVPPGGRVLRTEKVGSGHYSNLTMKPLKTGYPHLDAYGEARKSVAYASVDGYCRQLRNARKKPAPTSSGTGGSVVGSSTTGTLSDNVDLAALDAVRCIEHTMVVVSGEKSVYRCVVAPSSNMNPGGEDGNRSMSLDPQYQSALIASYSYVVSAAVDRLLDLIEYTFLREARCGSNLGASMGSDAAGGAAAGAAGGGMGNDFDIRAAASAAAAGLRIVDGVRMLGPSLSKLCELSNLPGAGPVPPGGESTIASALCISLHRSTVKYCAKTLENLARAIQMDPLDGVKHRPIDARVATVSSDVVHAIRILSPFISAYKSVSKRRSLPWDPNIGENSGEMDLFVRFLVKELLISLLGKAQNYKNDEGPDAQAKSYLFMMNNTFYLLELLAPAGDFQGSTPEGENHRINAPWFKQKMTQSFESEKQKYLTYWEVLNRHLTDVDDRELSYQGNNVLSLESGRLIKSRFSGFIEDFEQVYVVHRNFTVIDPKLRANLQGCVKRCFLSRYKAFYDKYSQIQFSKKNMENYLKYTPQKLDSLIGQLFSIQ